MLEITSYLHKYPVHIFESLEEAFKDLPANCFFLIDQNVFNLYGTDLKNILQVEPINSILVSATEENKSYENIGPILNELVKRNLKKNRTLVVIGGGVVQDIGCFIAHIYRRGLRWELFPTTLLAQSDSCIGSKSSVNIGPAKNQLGTFYPPHKVGIALPFLKTLTPADIHSGIGEIIKLALIDGAKTWAHTQVLLSQVDQGKISLRELLEQSLRIKKTFIEADEFDGGIRNVLNYGHTFGHAFETASKYSIPHGIAVLIGVQTATFFSESLNLVPKESYAQLMNASKKYVQPFDTHLRALKTEAVLEAFKSDKKNIGDKIRFVLPQASLCGNIQITPLDLQTAAPILEKFLKQY